MQPDGSDDPLSQIFGVRLHALHDRLQALYGSTVMMSAVGRGLAAMFSKTRYKHGRCA